MSAALRIPSCRLPWCKVDVMTIPSRVQDLASATANLSFLSRDKTYFLPSIYFLVEDTTFQVPRYHFERNDFFATTFKLPPPIGQQAEGFSEQMPIKLEFIFKKDFAALLAVLYPMKIPVRYNDITTEEWKSILKLSAMWEFDSVRELAIQELTAANKLDPVSSILLGLEYDVAQWLIAGCSHLIVRNAGPRAEEAKMLGEDLATLIWDLREQKIWTFGRRDSFNLRANIANAFNGYHVTFNV